MTPLQMAEVAAAIANEGKQMKPQIWSRVVDPDGRVTKRLDPSQYSQPISAETAAELTTAMEGVVSEGTGTNAAIPGIRSLARPAPRKRPATKPAAAAKKRTRPGSSDSPPPTTRRSRSRQRSSARKNSATTSPPRYSATWPKRSSTVNEIKQPPMGLKYAYMEENRPIGRGVACG